MFGFVLFLITHFTLDSLCFISLMTIGPSLILENDQILCPKHHFSTLFSRLFSLL